MSAGVSPVPPAIEVRHLYKTYGAGPKARAVVADCSFQVEAGKFTVMIGPSGVGKSTLIRLVAGFERPTRGEILVHGRPVTGPGRDRQVMFQETALFPWMNTRENVLYGPKASGDNSPQSRHFVDVLLERVGLPAFQRKYPAQLSGGMQRRAELARALVNKPKVLIMDEPFRGLDTMTKKLMLEYYAELRDSADHTDLFVTTDVDEAIFLADRLVVMGHLPTRVREVIDVNLPRPRSLKMLVGDERANDLKVRVLSLLHQEAMKSFSAGSTAAADFVEAYRRRVSL